MSESIMGDPSTWREREPQFAKVVDWALRNGSMCGVDGNGPTGEAIIEILEFRERLIRRGSLVGRRYTFRTEGPSDGEIVFMSPEYRAKETAGVIPADWLDTARRNAGAESTVEDWICRAHNSKTRRGCITNIDDSGAVWVSDSVEGRWLSQDEIDALCKQIDAGPR